MNARFELVVVTSADGFIGRTPGQAPQTWASAEEQEIFFTHVAAADWAIMGRGTHKAADRPDRRRIILSSQLGTVAPGRWRRPTQLWLDPHGVSPRALPDLVAGTAPLRKGLILGGTRVHDWFHDHGAIDRVYLMIEPVRFGGGLPVFSSQTAGDPVAAFAERGYRTVEETTLNAAGTRYLTMERA